MAVTLRLRDLPPELRARVQRRPLGAAANTLPEIWLEHQDGGWRIMERTREGGDDRCLAFIGAETVAALHARREPGALTP